MSNTDMKKELNQILLEKMTQEYALFINRLITLSPEEIINASYEKVFKEDILSIVSSEVLELGYVKALLRENFPLEGCYQSWLKEEVTYMEDLRSCMEKHAKSLEKKVKK